MDAMMDAQQVIAELARVADKKKATTFAGFFKQKPGYGANDIFIGVTVPLQRGIAKKFITLPLPQLLLLLKSRVHEHRLTALIILVMQFEAAKTQTQKAAIVEFFLRQRQYVDNWDLVDCTARRILGGWLLDKQETDAQILYDLARSKSLWDRRIAIVATHAFILDGKFEHTLKLSTMLLLDEEDLMHKATGWMLREMGKRDEKVLRTFLDVFHQRMPRTMLRYSLERLDEKSRKKYMLRK